MRVSPPGSPAEEGVVDFVSALMAQPNDHLTFGEARGGDDVAAYFHTGGTTGVPKLVAHTHRSQLVAAFGGASMCGYTSSDVLTATFLLFHAAGTIATGMSCLYGGRTNTHHVASWPAQPRYRGRFLAIDGPIQGDVGVWYSNRNWRGVAKRLSVNMTSAPCGPV